MNPRLFYEGNYVRIRVLIDVHTALKRVVPLSVVGEGKRWLFVKYEKVPFFCKHCGRIGHNHEECGDGVWSSKELQYGDFMLAVRRENPPTQEPRSYASRGRGSWRGRGSAAHQQHKRSSEDADLDGEDDLKDSASSPLKARPAIEDGEHAANTTAKKQIDFNMDNSNTVDDNSALVALSSATPPHPPSYIDPRSRNKLRKTATENDLATSVASLEEDRRAQ